MSDDASTPGPDHRHREPPHEHEGRLCVVDPVDCDEVGRVMQSFLDGELDGDVDAVRAHLEACLHCGLEMATYERIRSALAAPSPQAIDPEVIDRLRAFGSRLSTGG